MLLYNTPQVSERSKSRSNRKTKSKILSPGLFLTTVSMSSDSLVASPLSTMSANTNRSGDKQTIKNMNVLTVRSDTTHKKGVGKFISVVNTRPADLEEVN
jgi:hypothetical protein